MACKVFVGSLPTGTKPKELRHLFQNYGVVIECDVKNRCGFVHMETPTMAQTAILGLNRTEFKGQMINVEQGRSKETPQNMMQRPPNIICDDVSGPQSMGAPNFQGNRGFSRDGPPRMGGNFSNNRGGMSSRGGFPSSRGGFPSSRGGFPSSRGGGPPYRGGMQSRGGGMMESFGRRGGMSDRGGSNVARGGFNNRNQADAGPMRNSPSFKQRTGPYPPINGGFQNESDSTTARGGHKFSGNPHSDLNGPHNRNQNSEQRNNNWGNQNNTVGPPQPSVNFDNANAMSGDYRSGNMRNSNMNNSFGQDRRGFTLDNSEPPMQLHQQQHRPQQFGGNRGPRERNNFHAETAGGFGNSNMSDGPTQRGRGGGRAHFGSGRGGPARGGRGGFGGGRGGGPGNFAPQHEHVKNYNQEFPALQPSRGRGGFGGSNRGGFNRNAPNMMPNRRQNM